MQIRDYKTSDKLAILLLHDEFEQEYFPEFHSDKTLSKTSDLELRYAYYITQSGKFWVAEDQGVVIGLIGIQFQINNRADLIQLRVKKSHRRKGIATLLIKKVEEFALSLNKEKIYLHTADRLVYARKLYEKCGFRLEKTEKTSPLFEFTVLIYSKNLGDHRNAI